MVFPFTDWRDNLKPASFRGVPFEVEDVGGRFGRRAVLHEYPQRDVPYSEDLGRKAREWPVTAFVIGDDYMEKRDRLIVAMEAPGPGPLIHPTYGRLKVICQPGEVMESTRDGGMATFRLTFIEAGELIFPTSSSSGILSTTAGVKATAAATFAAAFNTVARAGFVATRAIDSITKTADSIEAAVRKYGSAAMLQKLNSSLAALKAAATTLITTPGTLAAQWAGALSVVSGNERGLSDMLTAQWDRSYADSIVPDLTDDEQAARDNERYQDELLAAIAFAQAADGVVDTTWLSYDEATEASDALAELIITGEEYASDPNLYATLVDMRTALTTLVEDAVMDLPRVRHWTPASVRTAFDLAELWYGDGTRVDEIIERNQIAHPGFVPVAELRMLSK